MAVIAGHKINPEFKIGNMICSHNLREGVVDFYTFSYYMSICVTVDKNAELIGGNMSIGSKNQYLEASDWG